MGHLRSYSSVLCHILGSHPQVQGYCETHIRYRWSLDLLRLRRRVAKLTGEPLRGRYVLDQILHDYPMARGILENRCTRAIILVRRPRETIQSIIESGLGDAQIALYRDFERVARYYEARLAGLLRLTDELRERAVFLEAELLLTHTREVLDRLGYFLELESPLQSEYRQFSQDAQGLRNPSSVIPTARINTEVRPRRASVSLPRALNARLQNAYDFWCGAIRRSCQPIAADLGTGAEHEDFAHP